MLASPLGLFNGLICGALIVLKQRWAEPRCITIAWPGHNATQCYAVHLESRTRIQTDDARDSGKRKGGVAPQRPGARAVFFRCVKAFLWTCMTKTCARFIPSLVAFRRVCSPIRAARYRVVSHCFTLFRAGAALHQKGDLRRFVDTSNHNDGAGSPWDSLAAVPRKRNEKAEHIRAS